MFVFVPVIVHVHVPVRVRVHEKSSAIYPETLDSVHVNAHRDDSGGVSWVGSNTEKRPHGDAAYFSVSRITSTTESSLLIFSITP